MNFLAVVDLLVMFSFRVYCLPLSNAISVPVHSYSLSLVCSTTFKVAVCGITMQEYLATALAAELAAGVNLPWVGMMLVASPFAVMVGGAEAKSISAAIFVPSTLIPLIGFSARPLVALNSEPMVTSISTRQKA